MSADRHTKTPSLSGKPGNDAARSRLSERLRHALWAGSLAFLIFLFSILQPVDQLIWGAQRGIGQTDMSGEIVFVGVNEDFTAPETPERRERMARLIERLNEAGVEQILIDGVFDKASTDESDRRLGQAIAASEAKVTLAVVDQKRLDGSLMVLRNIPEIRGSSEEAINTHPIEILGFVWTNDTSLEFGDREVRTLGSVLSGDAAVPIVTREIAYNFRLSTLPTLSAREITAPPVLPDRTLAMLRGKSVVIGVDSTVAGGAVPIPGYQEVPESFISIFAAETQLRGDLTKVGAHIILLGFFATIFLTIALQPRRKKLRRAVYAILTVALVSSIFVAPLLGLRLELSGALAFMVIYGVMRIRADWREKLSLRDPDTGLFRFRAFEKKIAREEFAGHVIVAKIHGFEHVLKTLHKAQRSQYVFKIVDRLRATNRDLELFNDNHYFAWHSPQGDTRAIIDHLEGLRALFGAPIVVDGRKVDVGITFGIASLDGDPSAVVPSAVAAAEEAQEATDPIVLADLGNEEEMLWNISMRARIDTAMECGEIYCLYQPKVDANSGELFGVEALVRWEDPERGAVSPAVFVPQCEKAGRMEDLTRYVLQSACSAGSLLHSRGRYLSMSVNVSATMLNNTRIVAIVREVLQASRFEPSYLVLEVTETARINDLMIARDILGQLKSLGIHISMDDFGVGAANFETFYRLPFDELKIDRLFVSNILTDPKARAIATSLVRMGNEARIAVVAEGVETPEELQMLMEIGCTQVQGYALSYPITLSKLLEIQSNSDIRPERNIV